MTMATTTIRIDIDTMPDHFERSRPSVVADVIEGALRDDTNGGQFQRHVVKPQIRAG